MTTLIQLIVILPVSVLFLYLSVTTLYLLVLAVSFFITRERQYGNDQPINRFAILVPAHNEEMLIGTICKSLQEVDYPKDYYVVYIIGDNCTDNTANIAATHGLHVLQRNDSANAGKGQALAWALQQIDLDLFDAVFIVDADNYVDGNILAELNRLVNAGEQAIQCYNAVGNREDSWFTQLLYVSRTISNQLYHEAKYRLGLSSYLMGNGLCFRADLLKNKGWTAFSTGEDWEYYTQLVDEGVMIGFAANAKVFHQESKTLNQATSQRLRWSSGRFSIARTLGVRLLLKGIKEKKWRTIDASFPLLLPNYSLLINLTLAGFVIALLLPASGVKLFLLVCFATLVLGQFLLFVVGAILAGSLLKTCKAVVFVPFFLIWKAVIDLLCITGLYRGKKWVRTKRH